MMPVVALSLLLQAAQTAPVLAFPEPGLDDSSAYQGYRTRFYRDSKKNAVQIYLDPRGGRVVHVWADAANESAGFTARDGAGKPASLTWGAEPADVADSAGSRSIEYRLVLGSPRVVLGWFLLGSMRVERDFQYAGRHLLPFSAPPFRVAEESLLVASVRRLPAAERRRHLALLGARSLEALERRLQPAIAATMRAGGGWRVRIERPSLDGRNRLAIELRVDSGDVVLRPTARTVEVRSLSGAPVSLAVRITTDAESLTPLDRREIFNREFHDFLSAAGRTSDSTGRVRARRLERQVRAVELLSTREKLMAGLPNFATYFGRDMMMTALMMRPVWSPAMSEHVIASVLRKLGPGGEVSHEEALGGQAIRENAVVYDSLVAAYLRAARGRRPTADSLLEQSREVLRNLQATRENYHMIDDEYQLPVLEARYLADSAVPAERKRAFLLDTADGGESRLARMLQELALVTARTRPYVDDPRPLNLISFPRRDSVHWRSASWRDSDAGYAGGRFAMDVNAIWAPHALEATATILSALQMLGLGPTRLDSLAPEVGGTPLGDYMRDTVSLRKAVEIWKGARRHFEVTLGPEQIRERLHARLRRLSAEERRYWEKTLGAAGEPGDSLSFLALSLDAEGRPIPVVNTDPATGLFLRNLTADVLAGKLDREVVLRDVAPFVRPFPVALFAAGLGPLVANDAYASPEIWERFEKDRYHGPRVVWGREVNLLFLGLANQIGGGFDASGRISDPGLQPYLRTLDDALQRTLGAVHASGLEHNELWSYRIEGGRLLPSRYGTSSDIQLWNGTNLAVQFVLSRLHRP